MVMTNLKAGQRMSSQTVDNDIASTACICSLMPNVA